MTNLSIPPLYPASLESKKGVNVYSTQAFTGIHKAAADVKFWMITLPVFLVQLY